MSVALVAGWKLVDRSIRTVFSLAHRVGRGAICSSVQDTWTQLELQQYFVGNTTQRGKMLYFHLCNHAVMKRERQSSVAMATCTTIQNWTFAVALCAPRRAVVMDTIAHWHQPNKPIGYTSSNTRELARMRFDRCPRSPW